MKPTRRQMERKVRVLISDAVVLSASLVLSAPRINERQQKLAGNIIKRGKVMLETDARLSSRRGTK